MPNNQNGKGDGRRPIGENWDGNYDKSHPSYKRVEGRKQTIVYGQNSSKQTKILGKKG